MNIVIEGIDGSGKSTLATHLSWRFGLRVQCSEGPPHYSGEIDSRIKRYLRMDGVLFDRHPAVSQPIYATLRGNADQPDPDLIQQFYLSRPLLIYCEPTLSFSSSHNPNHDFDTPEYLASLAAGYDKLLALYQQWAVKHASMIYRVPEPVGNVARMVAFLTQRYSDYFGDISMFHEKFSLAYGGKPRGLPQDLRAFREAFMLEELNEYYEKVIEGDLAGQLDALVDLVYVALGTAYLQGFPFDEAWRRVHAANMRKIRSVEPGSPTVRGGSNDVIKPPGWLSPDLRDLVA